MKILVGLTGAPEARAALSRAADEAKLRDAELIVLNHVRVTPPVEEVTDRYRNNEAQLEETRVALERQGLTVSVRSAMGVGSAGAELLKIAETEGVELIVIGLRKRSPVGKLFMGSTAQEVLLGAQCSVLAVKQRTDR